MNLSPKKVCREIGLNYDQVLLGGVIETLTDQQLKRAVEQYHIFAKLSPVHKERIVEQLKANGHVVGFLETVLTMPLLYVLPILVFQ